MISRSYRHHKMVVRFQGRTSVDDNNDRCDVQAVVKDYQPRPCIPGTALKGVLRAWAERFFSKYPDEINEVFGSRDINVKGAIAGKADFLNAFVVAPSANDLARFVEYLPYWQDKPLTAIASHVSIDRRTGAACANKLFFEEFVPEGVSFRVEIDDAALSSDAKAFLLAVLKQGAAHPTHPFQFGANGSDGWGRMMWTPDAGMPQPANLIPAAPPANRPFTLMLAFRGPFLVNDASRKKEPGVSDGRTNFTPLRRADGKAWLPASAFRGALRQRAEFLLRSVNPNATGDPNSLDVNSNGPIETLFGHTGQITRLTIAEFRQVGPCTLRHQDFVAIDRFTGGAAEGAKFDATYADRPTFQTTLRLDTDGLAPDAQKLLAAALRDVCEGRVPIGFGGAKGYGVAIGNLGKAGNDWLRDQLGNPAPAGQTANLAAAAVAAVTGAPQAVPNNQFIHPYYFLRMEDREGFGGDLADRAPTGHGRYQEGYYSGTIRVRLTTETPLLLLDTDPKTVEECREDDDPPGQKKGHKTYQPLTESNGNPLLASSSVRGMLRAAFEAVTNSRFGVFPFDPDKPPLRQGNARRYGYRMNASDGLGLVPVRIENGRIRLMLGTNPGLPYFDDYLNRWVVPGGLLHAAWVCRYRAGVGGTSPTAVRIGGQLPAHGQYAWCWLERIQHYRWSNRDHKYVPDFAFWAVRQAASTEAGLSPAHPPLIEPSDHYRPTGETRRADGYFFVSNQNIDRKHDERFIFSATPTTAYADFDDMVVANYHALLADYQAVHADEIDARRNQEPPIAPDRYLGREPGKTAHSRHVYEPEAWSIADGTLCYAAAHKDGNGFRVTALYPVMISRKLHERSPYNLLPKTLRPAMLESELSPADRVFGWVRTSGGETRGNVPAYRSQVRVGPVDCKTGDAIDHFAQPVPLAILGQPKPAQGRFYLGNAQGQALQDGISKEQAGYVATNRIRGPKVYPHHKEFNKQASQKESSEKAGNGKDKTDKNERTSQNRSITGWVKKEVAFEFDLSVTNLSAFELGALLWLLHLPEGCFLRLGLGKPLGFGSVKAEIVAEGTRLADGEAWAQAVYEADPPADSALRQELVNQFQATVQRANPDLLQAFQLAATGWEHKQIYYPPPPSGANDRPGDDGGGKHYEWFAANERPNGQRNTGQRKALPDLSPDPSLPTNPTGNGNPGAHRRS